MVAATKDPLLGGPLDDPYPLYAQLRHRGGLLPHPSGLWIAPRYAECERILRDRRFATVDPRSWQADAAPEAESPLREAMRRALLFASPTDHARIRGRLAHSLTPKAVEVLRPGIRALAEGLLAPALRAESFDLIAEYASPLPVLVMADLLGIPAQDRERFADWSRAVAPVLDPVVPPEGLLRATTALREFSVYIARLVEERRRSPTGDLLSRLAEPGGEGERLTEAEVVANCGFLLAAGHETTTSLIGNGVLALARNVGAWDALVADPALVPSAVEELLRYDAPVQMTARRALEDVEVAGVPLRAGRRILLLLGSANHDPERFTLPERLDLARRDNAHLSFGAGAHFCLGAALARVEAQVAFEVLLERAPRLEVQSGPVTWSQTVSLRGPRALTAWPGRRP